MKKLFEENEVIVLKADKSDAAPDVNAFLRELGNEAAAIPYYAVFKPDQPSVQDAIKFDGVYFSPEAFINKIGIENLTGNKTASDNNVAVENVELQPVASQAPPQGTP